MRDENKDKIYLNLFVYYLISFEPAKIVRLPLRHNDILTCSGEKLSICILFFYCSHTMLCSVVLRCVTLHYVMLHKIFHRLYCMVNSNWQHCVLHENRYNIHHVNNIVYMILSLTHWGRSKMAAIFQTTSSNAFSWMKVYKFRFRFHRILFLRVQLTIFQHWFR